MCCQIRSEQVALHLKIKQQHAAPQQHGKFISRYKAVNFNEKPGKSLLPLQKKTAEEQITVQQRPVPVGSEKKENVFDGQEVIGGNF